MKLRFLGCVQREEGREEGEERGFHFSISGGPRRREGRHLKPSQDHGLDGLRCYSAEIPRGTRAVCVFQVDEKMDRGPSKDHGHIPPHRYIVAFIHQLSAVPPPTCQWNQLNADALNAHRPRECSTCLFLALQRPTPSSRFYVSTAPNTSQCGSHWGQRSERVQRFVSINHWLKATPSGVGVCYKRGGCHIRWGAQGRPHGEDDI